MSGMDLPGVAAGLADSAGQRAAREGGRRAEAVPYFELAQRSCNLLRPWLVAIQMPLPEAQFLNGPRAKICRSWSLRLTSRGPRGRRCE